MRKRGLWRQLLHFLWTVAFCLGTSVLILWVSPFLLPAASRRHSRSTSALSTADSVGQSGEQVLTACLGFSISSSPHSFYIRFHQCWLALGMYALHSLPRPQCAWIFLSCWMFMVLLIGCRCFIACLTTEICYFSSVRIYVKTKQSKRGNTSHPLLLPPPGKHPNFRYQKGPCGEWSMNIIQQSLSSPKSLLPIKWWLLMLVSVKF